MLDTPMSILGPCSIRFLRADRFRRRGYDRLPVIKCPISITECVGPW